MTAKHNSLNALRDMTYRTTTQSFDLTKKHMDIPSNFCKEFIAPYSKKEAHKLLCEIYDTYKRIGILPDYHLDISWFD